MRLLTFSFFQNCRYRLIYYQFKRCCSNAEVQNQHFPNQSSGDPGLVEVSPTWGADEEPELRAAVLRGMQVFPDFISPEEEASLLEEVEPRLKRMRYESDHWDNAIEGYRETEREEWSPGSAAVLRRVARAAFPPPRAPPLPRVHVLDLAPAPAGHIRPHVDALRFCGPVIAGLCLSSPAVMRLQHARPERAHLALLALLPRRALYVISGVARYEFAHGVPSDGEWRGERVCRGRRVALICRSPPAPQTAPAAPADP